MSTTHLARIEFFNSQLVLATTSPAGTVADPKGIARVYGQRCTIGTAFETLKAGARRAGASCWLP